MSTALRLLEKKGLVERKAHPTDGRQINIKLTARGITLRRNTKEATYAWLSRAIAELDRQEQITLFKAGELFKRMADGIRDGKSASPGFDLALTRHRLLDAIQKASDSGVRQVL